jgi:23S rRNA pseudouridine955/2504/2580 synthase
LRVSCAAIGTPILGDSAYGEPRAGGNSALAPGLPALLHLHARHLRLPHPAGGWLSRAPRNRKCWNWREEIPGG